MATIESVGIVGRGAIGILYMDLLHEQVKDIAFICDAQRKKRYERTLLYCNGNKRIYLYR